MTCFITVTYVTKSHKPHIYVSRYKVLDDYDQSVTKNSILSCFTIDKHYLSSFVHQELKTNQLNYAHDIRNDSYFKTA